MTSTVDRILLMAGTSAGERVPAGSPGPEREWHLPAHVRNAQAVRERMSAQVAAGADVLLAHTFLTHRRALARVGEVRRARELTVAAIVLAREAAEQGRDRRDQGSAWATAPVLVAGALPLLGDDPGSGRLGPVDAAIARDLHDHAGLLADAGVDAILVEGPRSPAETAVAVGAARSVGIETWAVIAPDRPNSDPYDLADPEAVLVWVDAAETVERVLTAWAATDAPHGVMFDSTAGAGLAELLAAGATLVGISDGATPDRLAMLRAVIDAHQQERAAAREWQAEVWLGWVREGASRAPSGSALWLASTMPHDLPDGWSWTIAPEDELPRLPDERYRLVVCPSPGIDPVALARVLEPGGVLVAVAQGPGQPGGPLTMLERRDIDGIDSGGWLIARRR
ncbi:MAG: homocysteine S-methyltransferase family protein [Chloroflexi bacterium]|nr:homocysteine S-methyltransferase family protein [Chloroflexota bacterium]